MKRRALLTAAALSACASPDPTYYTLAPVPGPAAPGAPALVELRRPGIAGYLDRSEIVRSNTPYQLSLKNTERWGEPFGDMISRVLAEDLHLRLPGTSVFTSIGAISADAGARVEIDLQRLDADADGRVQLLAQVAIMLGRRREAASAETIRATAIPAGPSTRDYVAAMSGALGQAADRIAARLRR